MNESAQLPEGHKPFYTLQEIALILACRIRPDGEELRTTVDKVRKRILYAVQNDYLQVMGAGELQLFFAAQIFAWARRKWPDAFRDIPINQDARASDGVMFGDSLRAWVYPSDVERCHELLRSTYSEVELLKAELESAEKEIARLRPLAERYEENREKNRRAAKQPRKEV
jgi:hypothetical protein